MRIEANAELCAGANRLRLQVFEGGFAQAGTEWRADVVQPSFSRLYFITGGDGWYETGGRREPLLAGHCYLLPCGFSFRHGCRTRMEQVFFHVALTGEYGQDVFALLDAPLSGRFGPGRPEALLAAIRGDAAQAAVLLRTQALLTETVAELFEARCIALPRADYSPCVNLALQYIHSHASARLTLREVTGHAFVSQTTLSRRFRQEVGTSVGRYIEHTVLARAQRMLRERERSVAAISEELGYCDQFYFSRRFRRLYAQSPQSYRSGMLI